MWDGFSWTAEPEAIHASVTYSFYGPFSRTTQVSRHQDNSRSCCPLAPLAESVFMSTSRHANRQYYRNGTQTNSHYGCIGPWFEISMSFLKFRFCFGSFIQKKKTRIRFGMSLVQFGSKNAVRILELFTTHVTANITATVDDMTLTSLMSFTTTTTCKWYNCLSAMHGQNINLPVCVCLRVHHTCCQCTYRSDPSTDFYSW